MLLSLPRQPRRNQTVHSICTCKPKPVLGQNPKPVGTNGIRTTYNLNPNSLFLYNIESLAIHMFSVYNGAVSCFDKKTKTSIARKRADGRPRFLSGPKWARASVGRRRQFADSTCAHCACYLYSFVLLRRLGSWLGLTRVLGYSILSISGCKFPFSVAVSAVSWWTVGIYGNLGLRDFICNLTACCSVT